MKKTTLICALLLLAAIAAPAQRSETMESFWQRFKTAVTAGDKQAVARMTSFPLGMSYGVPSVRNRAALLRRYDEVFSQQADAAKCFGTKSPETEAGKPRAFTVACPDAAGNEVVIYHFERGRTGWKFVSLDNINE
ncbi:MAG TPA: hypothetical protein VN256_06945 [Pyrinomonadaceae bacterium]|nr:hypothetical protein [Pyrinomonadaceae bacterium]